MRAHKWWVVLALAGACAGGKDAGAPPQGTAVTSTAEKPKEAKKADDNDDDDKSASPFSPLSMFGALGKPKEPGPFDEPRESAAAKEGKPYLAVITLKGEIVELPKPLSFSVGMLLGNGGGDEIPLRAFTQRLVKMDRDDKVAAFFFRFEGVHGSMALAEELRATLTTLKKPISCHLETADNVTMLLASACGQLAVSPVGEIVFNGPEVSPYYVKGLLDSLHVVADFIHVGAFKGAAEPFTRTEPSPEMKQTYQDLLDGSYARLTQLVAAGRKVDVAKVVAWMDTALFTSGAAKDAGLVDEITVFETFRDAKAPGGSWKRVAAVEEKKLDLMALLAGKPKKKVTGPHIALIYAVGEVADGKGAATAPFGEITSGRLGPALRAAAADNDVKAIVLRVDSPGGSAIASEAIWRAADEAAQKKPVIISMGTYAASGGYYISSVGARIFAEPDTLTGSIGVIGGKIVLGEALDKLGVHFVEIGKAKRAGILSPWHKWTDDERVAMEATMEDVYGTFKARVAVGRKIDATELEQSAQGRVFTGEEALKRKLIDELGGLDQALAYARKQANLPDDVAVDTYPEELTLADMLAGLGGGGDGDVHASAGLSALLAAGVTSLRPVLGLELAGALDESLTLFAHFGDEPIRLVAFLPLIH